MFIPEDWPNIKNNRNRFMIDRIRYSIAETSTTQALQAFLIIRWVEKIYFSQNLHTRRSMKIGTRHHRRHSTPTYFIKFISSFSSPPRIKQFSVDLLCGRLPHSPVGRETSALQITCIAVSFWYGIRMVWKLGARSTESFSLKFRKINTDINF